MACTLPPPGSAVYFRRASDARRRQLVYSDPRSVLRRSFDALLVFLCCQICISLHLHHFSVTVCCAVYSMFRAACVLYLSSWSWMLFPAFQKRNSSEDDVASSSLLSTRVLLLGYLELAIIIFKSKIGNLPKKKTQSCPSFPEKGIEYADVQSPPPTSFSIWISMVTTTTKKNKRMSLFHLCFHGSMAV